MTPSHTEASGEGVAEALTGAHAGRVLSREIEIVPGGEAVGAAEGHTRLTATARERGPGAVVRRDPEHAWKRHHENRETPWLPWAMALWAAVGSPRTSSTDARPRGVWPPC